MRDNSLRRDHLIWYGRNLATVFLLAMGAAGQYAFPAESPALWPGRHGEVTDLEPSSAAANPKFQLRTLTGRLLHTWQDPLPGWAYAELVKPLQSGNILALIYDRAFVNARPRQKMLVEVDWAGNVVWQFDPRPRNQHLHHDFDRLANGNTLVIVQEPKTVPQISSEVILDELVLELDPAGNVIWEWSTVDHRRDLPISPAGWSYLATFPSVAPLAIFHLNSVQSLPANHWEKTDRRFGRGNLLLSFRETNMVVIIDRKNGKVVWDMIDETIGQHHPRMIPRELPGAGNILLFDNGGRSGAPPLPPRWYSRVVELDPISKLPVWSYECTQPNVSPDACPEFFFNFNMGAAQRLPNGNTLITDSNAGRVFEVTRNKATVWERTLPDTRVYRGYRWEMGWPNESTLFRW